LEFNFAEPPPCPRYLAVGNLTFLICETAVPLNDILRIPEQLSIPFFEKGVQFGSVL